MMRLAIVMTAALSIAAPLAAQGHSGSCTCGGFANLPVSWEIDHTDSAYRAAAEEVFDRWNRYLDGFDYRAGDGDAGPNGKNELVFLDIGATSQKYGINIDRATFAITYMSPLSAAGDFDACPKPADAICGSFSETDVIVNSDFTRGFTPSGPVDFTDSGPALYAATVGHELGHTLGFHHNVNNLSVMNLYEDFAAQYIAAADTVEARAAYPSRVRQLTDLAIYPFYFDPELTDYAATTPVEVSPTVIAPGGTLTVRNFGFENVGTEAVRDVQIRFYLSNDASVSTSDTLIGTLAFSGPASAGAYWDDERAGVSFTLPRDVPSGSYFVGALIADGAGTPDPVTYNNGWTAPGQVTIGTTTRRRAVAP